ncbi:MAG: DMT family transporter [Planctomycetaceae bacterium]|nr:DMT family transporter [Planctomycetaceae bacterium]
MRERWTGMVFAFISTMFYAVSNSMLRLLTQSEVPNDWMLFYKELIGVSFLVPWLAFRFVQGRYRCVSRKLIFYGFIASILCELIGARLHVLGFAVIGLVVAVPIVQSSTLLGTAVLGKMFLGDPLSRNRKIAISILIVAIMLLSIGKSQSSSREPETVVSAFSGGYCLLVAFGSFIAGTAYAAYIVMMRYVVLRDWDNNNSIWLSFQFSHWAGKEEKREKGEAGTGNNYTAFPITLMMSIVLATGVLVFGSCLFREHGAAGFYNVPDKAWYIVLLSGLTNLIGFFFQVHGLRMTTAVQASLISVSQMLVLSVIGFYFFNETINAAVLLGLFLTAAGIMMSAKPENKPPAAG